MFLLGPFFFGILAALIAFILELIFSFVPGFNFKLLFQEASWMLAVFVLIEELSKFSFVWKNFSNNISKVSPFKIFFQSLVVGLGFALTEVVFKASNLMPEETGEPTSYIPFLGAVLIHIGTSGLMGFLLLRAKKLTFGTFLQILLIAFGWHFLFNFFIVSAASSWLIMALLIALVFFITLAGFKIARNPKTYTQ